jgi:hypothetical protein
MISDAGIEAGASSSAGAIKPQVEAAGRYAAAGRPARPLEQFCTAADVPAEPVDWLWKNHFAPRKLSVVAGPANVGKTLLVTGDFASRVSAGTPWPDGSPCPAGDVLIAGRHDGVADTLVPRLDVHGADLRRVHFVHGVVYDNDNRPVVLEARHPRRTG